MPALGQHDAELLLSYLTVPYLRVPLVVSFFATDDRIHSLQSHKLQLLFEAALFEPGHHLPLQSAGLEPVDVPTSAPELLGTPHHLLLNELCRSPDTLLGGIVRLARQANDLDTGTLKSSTATIILFATRLCCRVDSYVSMLMDYEQGTHDTIAGKPFRGLACAEGVVEKLRAARAQLHTFLWEEMHGLLRRWYLKLLREVEQSDDEEMLDKNTKHSAPPAAPRVSSPRPPPPHHHAYRPLSSSNHRLRPPFAWQCAICTRTCSCACATPPVPS